MTGAGNLETTMAWNNQVRVRNRIKHRIVQGDDGKWYDADGISSGREILPPPVRLKAIQCHGKWTWECSIDFDAYEACIVTPPKKRKSK